MLLTPLKEGISPTKKCRVLWFEIIILLFLSIILVKPLYAQDINNEINKKEFKLIVKCSNKDILNIDLNLVDLLNTMNSSTNLVNMFCPSNKISTLILIELIENFYFAEKELNTLIKYIYNLPLEINWCVSHIISKAILKKERILNPAASEQINTTFNQNVLVKVNPISKVAKLLPSTITESGWYFFNLPSSPLFSLLAINLKNLQDHDMKIAALTSEGKIVIIENTMGNLLLLVPHSVVSHITTSDLSPFDFYQAFLDAN